MALVLSFGVASAQNYLDIARLNVGSTTLEDVDGQNETDVSNVNFEFLYPTPVNDKTIS